MNAHDIKTLFTEDRAVSPVIGVILMVAITVILAAVIGTFVLGMGDDLQNNQPTASFNMDFTVNDGSPDTVTISHAGGDTISSEDVLYLGSTEGSFDETTDSSLSNPDGRVVWDGSVSAGDSVSPNAPGNSWNGETVSVNWESADGTSSAQLASQQAP